MEKIMKQILQDLSLEKTLIDEGYVVIPFLTEVEVASLKDFYYAHHSSALEGMYATAHLSDLDLRMKMNDFIKANFLRAIDEVFVNANALGGSYIAKGKGEAGTLKPHQDWNIVDEDQYRSFNIWVPLVNLKEDNGAICIMPQSHLWQKTYRSANISSVFELQEKDLWERMSKLYMKAGEALIYDHRLIHASGENKTEEIRLATVFGIIPDEADMLYYHQKDKETVEVYESNPEFFLYGNIFEGPKGLKLRREISIQKNPEKKEGVLPTAPISLKDKIKAFFA
jgi:hypothetical protein